jgi:CHAT domain-containing protein/tetratricopeptide (TPR) repeat protein
MREQSELHPISSLQSESSHDSPASVAAGLIQRHKRRTALWINCFAQRHGRLVALGIVGILVATQVITTQAVSPERSQTTSSPQVTKAGVLQPGIPVEEALSRGNSHLYQLQLEANQYLRVAVDQKGVDVAMTLFAPDERRAGEVSLPRTLQGRKVIILVTEQAGNYRLEVRSANKDAAEGKYQLQVTDLREATATDRTRLELRKKVDEANRLLNQGTAESLSTAVKNLEGVLPSIRGIGDRWGEANALTTLGAVYYGLNEYQKTIEAFTPALALWKEVPDGLRGQAVAIGYISSCHAMFGDWQKVIESLTPALSIYQALGDRREEARTLNNIGSYYWRFGDREKALEYFELALPILRERGEQQLVTLTIGNIGNAHWENGERQRAVEAYNQALALSRSIRYPRGEAIALERLGFARYMMGENQAALDSLEKALILNRDLGDRRERAILLRHLGDVYTELAETSKALESLNESLAIVRLIGDRDGEARGLYSIARAHRNLNQLSQARADIESAIRIVESLRTRISDQHLRSFYSHWVTNYYELYIEILMRQRGEGSSSDIDSLAIEASERYRARSLLELLTESGIGIRLGVDAELLKRERTLQELLNRKAEQQIRLLHGKHTPEQAAAVAKEITSFTTRLQEVNTQIRVANPRYAALTQPEPLSLKQVQEQVLDADTLLLEYALGSKRSYMWAVTKTSIDGYELPGRAEIEATARRFCDLIKGKKNAEELAASGARLSHLLLAPVAKHLGTKRLAIVADGALQYVPFAALPAPQGIEIKGQGPVNNSNRVPNPEARPLILDHEIVNLPSASALAVLRRETNSRALAPKLIAVVADPVFDANDVRVRRGALDAGDSDKGTGTEAKNSGLLRSVEEIGLAKGSWPLPRLLGTRREARSILSLVPPQRSRQALDFEANRETVTSGDLDQYQIVHFATHGLINNRHPELSGLVLSLVDKHGRTQDGFLRLNEVYNLRLPAELVALSACQTGLGKEIRGEGFVGLTRGFMYAGAKRLMVSLWQVDDAATSELVGRFYRGLLGEKKLSPAAALRAAQIEMWRQKEWRSPYHWASFVFIGEWKM